MINKIFKSILESDPVLLQRAIEASLVLAKFYFLILVVVMQVIIVVSVVLIIIYNIFYVCYICQCNKIKNRKNDTAPFYFTLITYSSFFSLA